MLIDVAVLLDAVDAESPPHDGKVDRLTAALDGHRPIGFPLPTL